MALSWLLLAIVVLPAKFKLELTNSVIALTFDGHTHHLHSSCGDRRHLPIKSLKSQFWFIRYLGFGALEALLASEIAPVLEHISGIVMKGPVRALAWLVRTSWDLDKAVVE